MRVFVALVLPIVMNGQQALKSDIETFNRLISMSMDDIYDIDKTYISKQYGLIAFFWYALEVAVLPMTRSVPWVSAKALLMIAFVAPYLESTIKCFFAFNLRHIQWTF